MVPYCFRTSTLSTYYHISIASAFLSVSSTQRVPVRMVSTKQQILWTIFAWRTSSKLESLVQYQSDFPPLVANQGLTTVLATLEASQ